MKTLIFELNEFSYPLLQEAAQKLDLPAIKKLLSFEHSITLTNDTYESDFLEPWVQWVNVHTGVESKEHGIKHLGDVPHLGFKQAWEKLSDLGISTGVWGVMNGGIASAKNCHFFLPDPWSFSESATPHSLNALLDPLRYASKNYGQKKWGKLLKQFIKLLGFLRREKALGFTLKKLPSLIREIIHYRALPFVFISFLDELSTRLFLHYQKKFNPEVSFLFLNSIAHLLHHQWKNSPLAKDSPMTLGLKKMDANIALLFEEFDPEKDLIVTLNALSQQNTAQDPPWVLYRQKDHKLFLGALGIEFSKVEAHMTHDAHIFFENETASLKAKEVLEKVRVNDAKFFHVEHYPEEPNKLFYKIIFTDRLESNALLKLGDKSYQFFSLFKAIVQRTGKHIQTASLLCNRDIFPEKLMNHEVMDVLIRYLSKNPAQMSESAL